MSIKTKIRRELYSEAKKYLDIKSIFPNSKYVGRAPLTDYQAKKLSAELRKLVAIAGGEHYLKKDFVPIRQTKGAKKYIEESLFSKHAKGVLLPGGAKINKDVTVKNGAIFYRRGETGQAQFALNAATENTLEKSIRARSSFIDNPANFSYIGTAGGKISGVEILQDDNRWRRVSFPQTKGADNATDKVLNLALSLYIKYSAMAKNGEMRRETKQHGKRRVVHPKKWGMTLIVERGE